MESFQRGERVSLFYEKGTGEASREGRGYLFIMRREQGKLLERGEGISFL